MLWRVLLSSIAYGADGFMHWIHIDPARIGDDPKQAVKPERNREIVETAGLLWA